MCIVVNIRESPMDGEWHLDLDVSHTLDQVLVSGIEILQDLAQGYRFQLLHEPVRYRHESNTGCLMRRLGQPRM